MNSTHVTIMECLVSEDDQKMLSREKQKAAGELSVYCHTNNQGRLPNTALFFPSTIVPGPA